MVIFGAAGDLTSRKLIPALYNLSKAELLSREFAVIGISHSDLSTEAFRQKVEEDVKHYAGGSADPDIIEWFLRRIYYITGDFDDAKIYSQLKDFLEKVNKDHSTHGNYFFYLATAPSYFGCVVEHLAEVGLMEEDNQHWRRVIIEKPFGHDLESAKALNQQLLKVAKEKQIYRIDHYLGKETVQNRLNASRNQRQPESLRARSASDRRSRSRERGYLPLQRLNLRSKNEPLRIAHTRNRGQDFFPQAVILPPEV